MLPGIHGTRPCEIIGLRWQNLTAGGKPAKYIKRELMSGHGDSHLPHLALPLNTRSLVGLIHGPSPRGATLASIVLPPLVDTW